MGSTFDEIAKQAEQNVNLPEKDIKPDLDPRRVGRFTGSTISELMKTTSKSTDWSKKEKLYSFSEQAFKYIFEKAKERQRGYVIQKSAATLDYGKRMESVVKELLKRDGYEIKEGGFREIPSLPMLSVTPDGIYKSLSEIPDGDYKLNINDYKDDEVKKYNVEIKCPTSWGTYYLRTQKDITGMDDWWQMQDEMFITGIDKTLYVVAEPPENIFDGEPQHYEIIMIEADETAQHAIKERAIIGDKMIKKYLKDGGWMSEIHAAQQKLF